jgi:phosphoribosylglycinamide formyltransferase-1
VGVLCSGSGTNLGALLAAEQRGELGPASIRLVIVNRPGAGAIERATEAGVPVAFMPHGEHATREAYDDALVAALERAGCEVVALAGFMRLVTPHLLRAFPGRVLNIHPSLLPAFPGLHAQRQALEHGVKVTGCTVHLVDQGLDAGPIVLQAAVPVLDEDDEATLSARILAEEHNLYPRALRLLVEQRLIVEGRRVRLRGAGAA